VFKLAENSRDQQVKVFNTFYTLQRVQVDLR